ncbi:porin [Vibrio spartinae]|nr:porin [Vibrio spartinae]
MSGDEDDKAVFAGADVGFKITDNFLVNAEYTWYDVDLNANDINNGADTNTMVNRNESNWMAGNIHSVEHPISSEQSHRIQNK